MSDTRDIKDITDERGGNYGHPYDHFNCTRGMYDVWDDRHVMLGIEKDLTPDLDRCFLHIVYMICDKLARAAHNPMHMDNFDDIQGYASLWRKCVEKANDGESYDEIAAAIARCKIK